MVDPSGNLLLSGTGKDGDNVETMRLLSSTLREDVYSQVWEGIRVHCAQ